MGNYVFLLLLLYMNYYKKCQEVKYHRCNMQNVTITWWHKASDPRPV